jgi:hypothetical protein
MFVCDLCGTTFTERSWQEQGRPMIFHTYCPSRNPMGEFGGGYQRNTFSKEDVCRACHLSINEALSTAIKARQALDAAGAGHE